MSLSWTSVGGIFEAPWWLPLILGALALLRPHLSCALWLLLARLEGVTPEKRRALVTAAARKSMTTRLPVLGRKRGG